MKYLAPVVAAWMLTCVPVAAQAPDPQIVAPIQKFIDSFNKGDAATAESTHAAGADLVIIDEVPPYVWRGAKAFQSWAADLDADAKANGITEPKVTIAAPTRTEVHGEHAYVIVPAEYTFKQKGVAMSEKAQMTVVLQKGASGWLIHGWAWTGPKPEKGK